MKNKMWFRAKTYGWGWMPSSWEGWAVIAGYAGLVIAAASNEEAQPILTSAFILSATFILIWICYKKGEKPGWRWGK